MGNLRRKPPHKREQQTIQTAADSRSRTDFGLQHEVEHGRRQRDDRNEAESVEIARKAQRTGAVLKVHVRQDRQALAHHKEWQVVSSAPAACKAPGRCDTHRHERPLGNHRYGKTEKRAQKRTVCTERKAASRRIHDRHATIAVELS
jgi:hypothetical protein